MKINKIKLLCILTALAAIAISGSVSAVELDLTEIDFPIKKVEVHGFFSQGYMKSTTNDVYVGSKDGTMDLREYGINFSGYLTDDIFVATQIMAYNLGGQGDDEIFLHYGLVDYKLNDSLGIRLGRMRIPSGLYNETRDIDMIRKSVFLPQNIYCEYYRDYYSALDGVSIYGNFDLDKLGFLSYQAGYGKPITNESVNGDFPYNFSAYGDGLRDLSYSKTNSANFQLLWDTPVDGLRCSYTWRRLDVEFNGQAWVPSYGVWVDAPTLDLKNYVSQIWSAEYQIDKLTLMSEVVVRTSNGTKQNQGWYIGADYDFTDKFGAGMYYAEYVVTDESTEMRKSDQNTISLFGRYNITDSWLIKGQVDYNEGNGNSQFLTRKNATDNGDSMLFSVKTTWSF